VWFKSPNRIGLISDTHGLLRLEAVRALEGSELIIHAGDVGDPGIIEALKRLAPVFAVRGNVDTAPWARALPVNEVIETGSATIYILHDLHQLDLDPATAGFQIVVSGHSHKPAQTQRNDVLFLNPGSAGGRAASTCRSPSRASAWIVSRGRLILLTCWAHPRSRLMVERSPVNFVPRVSRLAANKI